MAVKSISIRIDEQLLHKLHIVSDYEGRSANSQIIFIVKKMIEQFENKHGEIDLNKK